ncbi:SDR family oxidoreductase [Kribbella deserti]|uniref:SDR family oxidoreductase n=1 Tax=Kribbella deserti TaxID=1926257 RepID=A0ABV6QI40_9ACTN
MTNRVALITGAASGIGAAIATRLAADGAAVALVARRADRLEKVAARIQETGGTAIAVPADVTDEASLSTAAQVVQDRLGDVDLLVNNAGSMTIAPFEQVPAAEWRRLVDVNLTGTINTTRIFLPALLRSAADRTTDLVNVSSLAANHFMAGMAVYGASKAAVSYLTKSLRLELAPQGIRVTNLEPGMTGGTELADAFPPELREMVNEMRTTLPAVQPDELADLVAYLVSRPRHVNLSQLIIQPAKEL